MCVDVSLDLTAIARPLSRQGGWGGARGGEGGEGGCIFSALQDLLFQYVLTKSYNTINAYFFLSPEETMFSSVHIKKQLDK